jgi:glycosyltransferase involved in cell wall biosynthesis
MYNYSIIIPHKNIPELLERCLASIPQRDDVQVIVVDDSSDPKIVDFTRFPGRNRPHTEIIFHRSDIGGQGGAGYARNCGIEVAKGRWLVFADADDLFHPAISDAFDRYAAVGERSESTASAESERAGSAESLETPDMIFFRHDSGASRTGSLEVVSTDSAGKPILINSKRLRHLAEMERTGNEEGARFMIWVPWGRFIRREMVMAHDIRFDEVRFSSNMMFSIKVGYFAERIVSDPAVVYCNVRREGSLIHEGRRDWEAMSQRFDVDHRAALFAASVGHGHLFDRVVAERWRELSRIDRRRARHLLPLLREVAAPGVIRRIRIEETLRRLFSLFTRNS